MEIIGLLGFFVISLLSYNREERHNQFLSKHKGVKSILPFFICFIIALLFSLNLSLSPIKNGSIGKDSAVFLFIGKMMYEGRIPYMNLFDHKGIVLYFIEYLGYLIGSGKEIGVWIIELLNIFTTTVVFYKICSLFTNKKSICFLSAFVILQFSSLSFFSGGNISEEYALPWISLTLFFVIKLFVTNSYKAWNVIVIGISFAIVLFLRVNMVGLWGILVLSVVVFFIKEKQFKDIFKCGFLFVLGCLIVIIPILIYLQVTNSMDDMINYYFKFNFSYTGSGKSPIIPLYFLCVCIQCAGISSFFVIYSMVTDYKNKITQINLLSLLIAFLSAAISFRSYEHYGIILIPFFVIPTISFFDVLMVKTTSIINQNNLKVKNQIIIYIAILSCIACVLINPAFTLYESHISQKEISEVCNYLSNNTKKEDDVLVLKNNADIYINADRSTKNKFFYQEPPIDISDELFEEFMNELKTVQSDYIVIPEDDSIKTDKNYQMVIDYLNKECEKGIYQFESYDSFQIYIRK